MVNLCLTISQSVLYSLLSVSTHTGAETMKTIAPHDPAARELFDEMFYWAPAEAEQTEVDFLLRRGKDLVAIEAKSSPTL